ncbi:tripartite tricarboxylate transporter substrate binding protein [Verminephrobacter eiseniae]|uniref:Bug family tripartite tricarboxylate transporter substrate binding protein n=1 Tax=Verminephrobacter eiseniae TaxID=364317 RepID=UPI0022389BE1|nr:tripartite tricarboxylate transporter substrate binding protein [Verminephrobacter eiseniae]MCW5259672.1 tripartite tricarboxylate transporter substrate binding protein [Verminephrobacter eiseniae]
MQRRHFLLAAMAPLAFGSAAAAAPAYPGRPVRILVGYSAGGPTDQVARMVAAKLQERFGQAFIVENRAGVGSNIASEAVAAAPADGHTLLLAAAPITMNRFVYQGQKFDAEKSFDPISKLSSAPGVLAVRPGLAVNTVAELIALAKSSGGISYGSTGLGGSQHMAAELLQRLTGMALTHVPYKGASGVLSDLIAGHIGMAFMTATSAMPNLQAGKIKPLAIAGPRRLSGLPQVPTFAESGLPDMVSDSWNGLLAPAGTPAHIISQLHEAAVAAINAPDVKDKLQSQGALVIGNSPQEFRDEIRQEVAAWAAQFKHLGRALQ